MKIEDLRPAIGSRKRHKIVGRGPGSGHGKTSTRGHKGQLARSGKNKTPGFEGGQMPLVRKIPKRGFNRYPKRGYHVVNLENLVNLRPQDTVTPELLKERGLVKGPIKSLKVLGDGNINVAMTVKAHAFSKSAIQKITKAGGKCEVIN